MLIIRSGKTDKCLKILDKYTSDHYSLEPFHGLSLQWALLLSKEYNRLEQISWQNHFDRFKNIDAVHEESFDDVFNNDILYHLVS